MLRFSDGKPFTLLEGHIKTVASTVVLEGIREKLPALLFHSAGSINDTFGFRERLRTMNVLQESKFICTSLNSP